jgi:hypothetical protein
MKKHIKPFLFAIMGAGMLTGCVSDDDTQLAPFTEAALLEDFEEAVDATTLDIAGWTNFAETGSRKWREERFDDNGYAEFSPFGANEPSNIGWLVSPAINLDGKQKKLTFETAQHHLTSEANTFQVLISTNFDGINVTAATWTPLDAVVPTTETEWYEFVESGIIDLTDYSGTVHIAFKVVGNGSSLSAGYQIDNVAIL